jgi:8-oxo-dGTP pyrophosphatase MutT (NUDIX family)
MYTSPARTMIMFKQSGANFTYRVGGIAIHNGHVLFQKATANPDKTFWFLPGGRAELGESAAETLRREMMEELNVSITIERPVFVLENFFKEATVAHHELGMYFLMHLPPDSYVCQQTGPFVYEDEPGLPLIFEWLPLNRLVQFPIMPTLFCTALQTLPLQLTHLVHIDTSTTHVNLEQAR